MMKRTTRCIAILALLITALSLPTAAHAHGATVEYTAATVIEIVAEFDGGDPMSQAQVAIYAPNDLKTPWLTGVCDDEGRFTFTPDASIPGVWEVQVRNAGHGDTIHITVTEEGASGGGDSDLSTSQIILMSVCVIWGLLGTALYFRGRRT